MQQNDALIVDYGPTFHGTAIRTGNGIVCVVPIQILDSPQAQASMQEMVGDLGGKCGQCPNCPMRHAG
jgi:hypothetical protein